MTNIDKLRGLLVELHPMDGVGLDSSLGRIVEQRRNDLLRYLEHDLLPQVSGVLKCGASDDRAADAAAWEAEIVGHLEIFFRRFYRLGEFLTDGERDEAAGCLPPDERYFVKSSGDHHVFDSFIHKDLGGFLRRALDAYVKDEVMRLDDLEDATTEQVENWLCTCKGIRRVAGKIIQFLAQLEDFKKTLWLKKKFVVDADYWITLDRVPQELYAEIAANDAQWDEWVKLFSIDEVAEISSYDGSPNPSNAGASTARGDDATAPSRRLRRAVVREEVQLDPRSAAFLVANPQLILDTRHFSRDFKLRLLASIDDIDGDCDGLLVMGENFQALNLLTRRYSGQVDCIYIDPPYNTGDGKFPFNDRFGGRNWSAMIDDRLSQWRGLLRDDGSLVCHIDEHEFAALESLIDRHFGTSNNIGPIVWDKRNPKGDAAGIATQHEYICWALKDFEHFKAEQGKLKRNKENALAILAKAAQLMQRHGGVTAQTKRAFKT